MKFIAKILFVLLLQISLAVAKLSIVEREKDDSAYSW